ncbi:MAG: hypothetical protein P8L79_08685 [Rhodospirillaceae bacterium]|jgi:hypothetical protein|nr:hypothetical protein [Rhodospirillaceae bacterium]
MNQESKVRVPQTAKGHRPTFFDDPVNDRLTAMMMSMVTEMWVMRERLDSIEALAAEKGVFLTEELERFEPSPERAEERERMRQEFLDRIFYIFQEEAEDTDRGDTEDTYEEAVNISAN